MTVDPFSDDYVNHVSAPGMTTGDMQRRILMLSERTRMLQDKVVKLEKEITTAKRKRQPKKTEDS